ncbi:MAG: alpha-hydroxy acid oxidase [Myxococcota bacterium]
MQPLSISDFEHAAKCRLDTSRYDFCAGGADDEVSLRANEQAFRRIGLLPRVLRAPGDPNLGVSLLGSASASPILLAPTAFHKLFHPDGECATARAAAAAGCILIVSMASTTAIEDIARASREASARRPVPLWFQLNIQPDLAFTEFIVRRAEAAACEALVVSVDAPVLGRRPRDLRNGFHDLPAGMCCENLREAGDDGKPATVRPLAFSTQLGWEQLDWLRSLTRLPIVLKGIVRADDARIAVGRGVDAILVSNHGGRQLDGVPPTIELLPAIAAAVGDKVPLLLDGGIRRGTDVIKAIALGARAVAVGRPILWGLAANGEAGVLQVLELLRDELRRGLSLCGCRSLSDLDGSFVHGLHPEPA